VNETEDGLQSLQDLMDRSYDGAGRHLRDVTTPERILAAQEVCARLSGMRLLAPATVTSDNRPGPGR